MSNWQKVYSPPVLVIVFIVGLICSLVFFSIGGSTFGIVAADPEMKNDANALVIRTCCQVLKSEDNCFVSRTKHSGGTSSQSFCAYHVLYPSSIQVIPPLVGSENCTLSLFQNWMNSTQSYQFKNQLTINRINQNVIDSSYNGSQFIDLYMNCYLNPTRDEVAINTIYSRKYEHMYTSGIVFLVFGFLSSLIAFGYPLFGLALLFTR